MTFQSDLEARVRYEAAVIAGKARETLERELQRAAPVGTPNPYQDRGSCGTPSRSTSDSTRPYSASMPSPQHLTLRSRTTAPRPIPSWP